MLQGVLPGSVTVSSQVRSHLLRKRNELYELYKSHFNRYLRIAVIVDRASRDRRLASQIYLDHQGQSVLHTALVMDSDYYKASIKEFIKQARDKHLITDVLGQGVNGLTLLMEEQGCNIVIKLPVNPSTDFEGSGYCALRNEFDHTHKVAAIDGIDHTLTSRPVDGMSIRGKLLAFAKFSGRDLFSRDDYNNNRIQAFTEYSQRESFSPERIAELIKIYMKAYTAGISTLSYGSPHNTRLVEGGNALALFDMCSQPPTPEHDLQQMHLQTRLFGKHSLACALFQVLGNGNVNFLLEGEIGTKFRLGMLKESNDDNKRFSQYREKLLKESLEVLLIQNVFTRDELISNLESLRDINDRIKTDDLKYLKFKDVGKLILKGQDLMQTLIEHFSK